MAHAHYGVDRPDLLLVVGVLVALLIGLGLAPFPGHSILLYLGTGALIALGVLLMANPLKPRAANALLDSLPWRGNERVLDVGCGRGLWLISAAKHLTNGEAVGVDIWDARLQSGNSPERALQNARIEGVAGIVELCHAKAQSLPFGDETFDTVLSSYVIHHVPKPEQGTALREMVRVLRPGGTIAMLEGNSETKAYATAFRELGMSDTRTSWPFFFANMHTLRARKPLGEALREQAMPRVGLPTPPVETPLPAPRQRPRPLVAPARRGNASSSRSYTTAFSVPRSAKDAFFAINDVRGWWSGEVRGRTRRLGGVFTYRYGGFHRSKQKVTELVPGKRVAWLVVDGGPKFVKDKSEWKGTRIVFEISRKGNRTQVRFTHQGLVPRLECYDSCADAWGSLVRGNLRSLIVKGRRGPRRAKKR